MPKLFQWELILRQGVPLGLGIVSDHQRLPEGTYVHTSRICHVERVENSLRVETLSGNIYHLQMKERDPGAHEAEALNPEQFGLPADFWTRCTQAREEATAAEKAALQPMIRSGTLCMRIVGMTILSVFWRGTDAQICNVSNAIHRGMVQISYLDRSVYRDAEKVDHAGLCFLSLHLSPMLEPYHISGKIKSLLVRNEGRTDVVVGSETKRVLCLAGRTTSIPIGDQSCNSRQLKLF